MIQETNGRISKQDYYRELHAAARSYNTKLWAIPPLFVVVAGFVTERLLRNLGQLEEFTSYETLILLLGGAIIGFMLLSQSLKDSYFQILIQKKINELERNEFANINNREIIPLFSATDTEMLEGILWLKKLTGQEPVKFSLWKEFLIRRRVSDIFFSAVILFLVGMGIGLIVWTIGFFS